MRRYGLLTLALVVMMTASALALESRAFQLREDFDAAPLDETRLQYYYYIPCPTYSWFWAFTGWEFSDWIGCVFECEQEHTGCYEINDPWLDHTIQQFRILDFAGYGTVYPGLFTVEFYAFCADRNTKNPVDEGGVYNALWYSGPWETHFGWNYIPNEPAVCVTPCGDGDPPAYPAVLIMAHHIGTSVGYPAWGLDNVSTAIAQGCILHDYCSLPAHFPRPYVCYWDQIHSGYYGSHPFTGMQTEILYRGWPDLPMA